MGAYDLGGFLTGGLIVWWLLSGGFLPGLITYNPLKCVQKKQISRFQSLELNYNNLQKIILRNRSYKNK